MNLVGLKDGESIVSELLYDALFLHGYVKESESILDMGSGSGILAIPLKILNKDMKVFSVDRTLKKIQFQRHIQRTLKLDNFFPIHDRMETLEPISVQSLVVKAFGSIPNILTKGRRVIRNDGHAFLLKGKTQEPDNVDGFIIKDVISYTLPNSVKSRTLFIYRRY
jgi:16S rRNA (guanine527-N7)-methyltransferase